MEKKDLELFNEVPFLFWVKDEKGTYLWGNKAISQLAGENVAGKTDRRTFIYRRDNQRTIVSLQLSNCPADILLAIDIAADTDVDPSHVRACYRAQ